MIINRLQTGHAPRRVGVASPARSGEGAFPFGRLLFVCCLLASSSGSTFAQHTKVEPDPSLPLPGTFSNAVPEGTQWVVRILRQGEPNWPDQDRLRGIPPASVRHAAQNPRLPEYLKMIEQRALKSIDARYSSGIRRELLRQGDGTETERYISAGLLMHRDPETREIHLHAGGFSVTGPVWGIDRFGELSWVGEKNYIGAANYRGKPCYVFREFVSREVPNAVSEEQSKAASREGAVSITEVHSQPGVPVGKAGDNPRILRTAFIHRETLLPVAWETEGEIWEYEMKGTGPAFRLPADYRQHLQEARETLSHMQERFIVPQ